MARRRAKGAVAAATESGFEAEDVQEGIDEILGMASPAAEPDNLGNFRPDVDDGPRGRRPPERKSRPNKLATPEEEAAAERALSGKPEPREDDEPPPPPKAARPELEEQPAAADDTGDDDQDPRDRELAELRAWRAQRDLQDQDRDRRLDQALDQMDRQRAGGRGAAPAGDAIDADPRATELARRLRPENIVPFAIDDTAREAMGLTPQGAKTLDAMFRAQATHVVQLMLHAYSLDQELVRTQSTTAERAAADHQDELTRARDAFYAANADLTDYQFEVTAVSRDVAEEHARRTGRRISPAEWIPETSRRVREHLRSRGVQVRNAGAFAPTRTPASPAAGGYGRAPQRTRPAGVDFGAGGGGNGKAKLSALEDEMFAMARAGM